MDLIQRIDLRWLALLGGIGYAIAITLVATQADTDPVGPHYDAFNRFLGIVLVVIAASAFSLRVRIARRGLVGFRAATALAVGFAGAALGSLIEFWGALIAGQPAAATAERTGANAFVGADLGFAVFAISSVVALGSALALARAAHRWPGTTRTAVVAIGSIGLLNLAATSLWAVSPVAAVVPGVLFAFAWLTTVSTVEAASEPAAIQADSSRPVAP